MEELKCKVCGKLASEDCNFNKGRQLCNAHNLQFLRHGKILSIKPTRYTIKPEDKVCCICNDNQHKTYYTWTHEGELYGKVLCGKHYNQMLNHNMIIDFTPSEHKEKIFWTNEDKQKLEELFAAGKTYSEIAKELNRSVGSCSTMGVNLRLGDKYPHYNNPNIHYVYQDYDWMYNQMVTLGKSCQQIADEFGFTRRVIEKWANEKFNISNRTFKDLAKLNDIQKMIIISGTLGDGHISNQSVYIESHADNQKDYIFWKYHILHNLCLSEPAYYPATVKIFGNKEYLCRPSYRLSTRMVSEFLTIKNMSTIDKINYLDELGISTHVLDDGSCNEQGYWSICVAGWDIKEIDAYIAKFAEHQIILTKIQDMRYLNLNKDNSEKLTQLILRNIPNDLDIIQYKIFNNRRVS